MNRLSIQTVALAKRTWERSEFALTVEGADKLNPFRSSEIAIDALFILPSGSRKVVPAYWSAEYALGADGAAIAKPGSGGWRLRFSGAEPGAYTWQVVLRCHGVETARIEGPTFSLIAGDSHGMIRIAPASPKYMEHADGTPYFAMGENMAFPSEMSKSIENVNTPTPGLVPMSCPTLSWDKGYARWMKGLGEAGGNWARVWMPHTFYLEDNEPWQFNLEHAWRLDYLLELAEQHGIHVCLCMDYFRTLFGEWGADHWNGGEKTAWRKLLDLEGATSTTDFFRSRGVDEMMADRFRYLVGRYGWSSNIFCWELFNEFETLPADEALKLAWTQRATAQLRAIDCYGHLVKSSAHWHRQPSYWGADCGDLNDLHPYVGWHAHEGGKDLSQFFWEYSRPIDKANHCWLLGEAGLAREVWMTYGIVAEFADMDKKGVNLHECLWAGMFCGSAGTAMPWWWDEQVDQPNLYWRYRGIAAFAKHVPWNRQGFLPAPDDVESSRYDVRIRALRGHSQWLLWLQSRFWTYWNVIHGAPQPIFKGMKVTLHDVAPGEYRVEWWNTETGAIVHTDNVASNGTRLTLCAPDVQTDLAAKVIGVPR